MERWWSTSTRGKQEVLRVLEIEKKVLARVSTDPLKALKLAQDQTSRKQKSCGEVLTAVSQIVGESAVFLFCLLNIWTSCLPAKYQTCSMTFLLICTHLYRPEVDLI